MDLPGGGAKAAEDGGLGFDPRLVIPCKIVYDVLHEPLGPCYLVVRLIAISRD